MNYAATPLQTRFFTSVWAAKQRARIRPPNSASNSDEDNLAAAANLAVRSADIAANLAEWGAAMAALKARDPKQWDLLGRQLQLVLQRFNCPQEMKEDAAVAAIIKILQLLDRMPGADLIEAAGMEGAEALLAECHGLYDFSTSFYGYAKVTARNVLHDMLRRTPEQSTDDDLLDLVPAPDSVWQSDGEGEYDDARRNFAIELRRLMLHIDRELPRRQRAVIWLTLAARPQFWRAIDISGSPMPDGLDRSLLGADDSLIAQKMNANTNNVRVLRSLAKSRMAEQDQFLAGLLARLIDSG